MLVLIRGRFLSGYVFRLWFEICDSDRDCITVVDAVDNENNVDVDVVAVAEAVNGDAEFVVLGTTVIKLLALVPRPAFGGFRIDEVGTEIEQNDSVKKISKFYLPFWMCIQIIL